MSTITTAELLFQPDPTTLGFLPEGPIAFGDGRFSWVGIQHGPDATQGSLNRFDIGTRQNQNTPLEGRPGFAFPLDGFERFLIGLERSILEVTLDPKGEITQSNVLCDTVDQDVTGTIINDGVMVAGGVIFGCKDLKFAEKKAGLYYWQHATLTLHQLRNDQTCSNGKVVLEESDSHVSFLDIDTPTQRVMRYELSLATGQIEDESIVLDLANETGFPDGMVGTPDGRGVIIAFFNPEPAEYGIAKWIDIETGQTQQEWHTEGSPQVTCPLLVKQADQIQLVLTTAAENMTDEQRAACPNAGSLFMADTPFAS